MGTEIWVFIPLSLENFVNFSPPLIVLSNGQRCVMNSPLARQVRDKPHCYCNLPDERKWILVSTSAPHPLKGAVFITLLHVGTVCS